MRLDAFRAAGRACADLGEELQDEILMGSEGRVYPEGLYIERWVDDRHGFAPPNGPTWLLTLGNMQTDGELRELEALLFDWATATGCWDN